MGQLILGLLIDFFVKVVAALLRQPEVQDRAFRLIRKLGRLYGPLGVVGLPNAAVILAAGSSIRWQASIDPKRIGSSERRAEYSYLYWEDVTEKLRPYVGSEQTAPNKTREEILKEALGIDPPEKDSTPSHKGLAQLYHLIPLIYIQFIRYFVEQIEDIYVVISQDSPAQEEMDAHINLWNKGCKSPVEPVRIQPGHQLVYSAFEGLRELLRKKHEKHEGYGYAVVSFSDIVWGKKLLGRLLRENGDIVVVVDERWEDNYRRERIWHDMRWAEVVCGKKGEMSKVGELLHRFVLGKDLEQSLGDDDLSRRFRWILEYNQCYGEIVGLFKFSQKGRDVFIKTYDQILRKGGEIAFNEWDQPKNEPLTPKTGTLHIQRCLFGDFLEYLWQNRERLGIKVKILLLKTEDNWAEIDHWGDLSLARHRFPISRLF